MEAGTLTLTDFLLARIAEDEGSVADPNAGVHRADCEVNAGVWMETGRCDCGYPARVLAECEAKRRIVAEHKAVGVPCGVCRDPEGHYHDRWPCPTVRFLALPYADHPDYREEWRA